MNEKRIKVMVDGIEIENTEGIFPFMKRKMAVNYYRNKGYEVIDSEDFEYQMLKYFLAVEKWREVDRYTKVKTGLNVQVNREYCNRFFDLFGVECLDFCLGV